MADTEFKKQLDKWIKSEEGRACMQGVTESSGKYLQNRLFLAFTAGYSAATERLRRLIKECEG